MRWRVEFITPEGGSLKVTLVEADSWKAALASARGGKALTRFRTEFGDEDVVTVNDVAAGEHFRLRPATDADAATTPAVERPAAEPATVILAAAPSRAAAPTPSQSPAAPAPASASPPSAPSPVPSAPAVAPAPALTPAPKPAPLVAPPPPTTTASPTTRPSAAPVVPPAPPPASAPIFGATLTPSAPTAPAVPSVATLPVPAAPSVAPVPTPVPPTPGAAPAAVVPVPAPAAPAVRPSVASFVVPSPGPAAAPKPMPSSAPPKPALSAAPVPAPAPPVAAARPSSAPASVLPPSASVPSPAKVPPEAPGASTEARAPSLPPPAEVIPPPARLLFQRNKEAEGNAGLTFRERVLGVPEGTPTAEAERIAQQVYRALRASLGASTTGRFVSIAVFDHFFSQRPERPPVVVLNWKDWRGDEPEVSFPTQPAHGRVTLQSEPPRAADTIPNAPVAQLPPSPAASPTPAPAAPSSAPVASLTTTTEASVVVPLVKVTAEPVTTVFASAALEKPAVAPTAPAPIPPAVPPPATPSASNTTEASVVLPLVKVTAEPVTTVFASAAPEVLQPAKPTADSTQELSAQDLVETKKPSADATGELDIPVHVEDDSEDVPVEVEQPQAPPAPVPTPEAPPSAAPQVPAPSAPPPQSLVQAPATAPQSLVQAPVAAVEPAPPVAPAPASLPPAAPRSIPPSGPLQPGAPQWTAAPEVSSTPDSRPIHRTSMPAMVAVRPPTQGPGRSRGEELLSDVFLGTQDLVFLRESRQACEFVAILGRDMLHASSVLVALYDLDRDELVVEAMLGEGSTIGQRTALVGGVRGDAAIRDRLVALDRAPSGDSFCPRNPGGAVVYAPVRHDRRLLGMLELYRQPDAERFDLDEQHAAAFVAQQLARWLNDFSRRVAIESEQQDQRSKRPR